MNENNIDIDIEIDEELDEYQMQEKIKELFDILEEAKSTLEKIKNKKHTFNEEVSEEK
jgi:hypothetical protein